jgi:hypothetical protein
MTQTARLELPESLARKYSFGECTPIPSVGGLSHGASRRIQRSHARAAVSALLWLTSLRKPGVFEVVPMENVSRFGIQVVTQTYWEPAERVLASSPPEFCVHGSVVYCKKLPSDDHILGIRLDTPVEQWRETLGLVDS